MTCMQSALNAFATYCADWDLTVNIKKTKIIVFSRGKIRNIPEFTFLNEKIEVVFEYKYLGIIFTYNGNFNKAKKYLFDQATRAMYALISKSRKLQNLPIDIQLHLFDSLVVPILLYGCEIWGFENNSMIEKLHLKYCKTILHVKKSTPSCMVYGELGRFPLDIRIKCRLITFWSRLVSSDLCFRTSCILYNLMYSLYVKDSFHSNWLKFAEVCEEHIR